MNNSKLNEIKAEYLAGKKSKAEIARLHNVSSTYLNHLSKKHGWIYGELEHEIDNFAMFRNDKSVDMEDKTQIAQSYADQCISPLMQKYDPIINQVESIVIYAMNGIESCKHEDMTLEHYDKIATAMTKIANALGKCGAMRRDLLGMKKINEKVIDQVTIMSTDEWAKTKHLYIESTTTEEDED